MENLEINDVNNIYENINFITTNEIVSNNENDIFYNVCSNIYTMLSVLTFTIIVVFLFNYLKSTFSKSM